MTECSTIGIISPGGPGSAIMIFPFFSTIVPGAVPTSFGMAMPDSGLRACFKLLSKIGTPRRVKKTRIAFSDSGSITSLSPRTSAMVSLVRSSWVGPRPPTVTTRSALDNAALRASASRRALSPTVARRYTSIPRDESTWLRYGALVSTICPSRSSVPTEITSACTPLPPMFLLALYFTGVTNSRSLCARAAAVQVSAEAQASYAFARLTSP